VSREAGALEAMEREPAVEEEDDEEEEVACECCGFTEECTAPYIAGVRARFGGRWICGLCGDAVGEELGRAGTPPISPAEALDRHARACRGASAPPSPAGSPDGLIAALRLLLRRRLGSPPASRKARSTPSSPTRDAADPGVSALAAGASRSSLARTGSCFAALVE
jgi:hypothetical protein